MTSAGWVDRWWVPSPPGWIDDGLHRRPFAKRVAFAAGRTPLETPPSQHAPDLRAPIQRPPQIPIIIQRPPHHPERAPGAWGHDGEIVFIMEGGYM